MAVLFNKEKVKKDLAKINEHEQIVALIREKYTASEECAILRKKLAGIDNGEFEIYNSYVEECKKKVKGGKNE